MKKCILFAFLAMWLAACNVSEPNKAFVGIWEPGETYVDLFVISSDSIKAIHCNDGRESFQSHYKMVADSIAKLERCWLKIMQEQNHEFEFEDSQLTENVYMYFDEEGYLIIPNYDCTATLNHASPNYSNLKLKRHE